MQIRLLMNGGRSMVHFLISTNGVRSMIIDECK